MLNTQEKLRSLLSEMKQNLEFFTPDQRQLYRAVKVHTRGQAHDEMLCLTAINLLSTIKVDTNTEQSEAQLRQMRVGAVRSFPSRGGMVVVVPHKVA